VKENSALDLNPVVTSMFRDNQDENMFRLIENALHGIQAE
jgi:hypothetical protein